MNEKTDAQLFTELLDRNIADHPERLQAADASLVDRLRALVGDAEVDFNSPLPAEVDKEWVDEALRRRESFRNGETTAVPWSEAKARLAAINPHKDNT